MISLIAAALLGAQLSSFSGAPEMADDVPACGLAASIQIGGTSSDGEELSPSQLDSPQRRSVGGGMSSQGPDEGGTGITHTGDATQVAVWSQLNETMMAMLNVMRNMHDQQGRQISNDEMQVAAMEALTKVSESMKSKLQ